MPANNGNVKHEAGCLYARIAEKRNSRKPTPLSGKEKRREEIELALMEGGVYRPIRLSRRLPHHSTKQVPLVPILGLKRDPSPLFTNLREGVFSETGLRASFSLQNSVAYAP